MISLFKKILFQPACFIFLCFLLCFVVYWQGLNGGFLFDDFPNLETMGQFGQVSDWNAFRAFVFSGWSGPTGRPLSLASFLLDDNTWPSYAPWFKHTNLLIHILCGLLLCWATLLFMRNLKTVDEKQAQWIAVLTCALWVLHPYMVSTTLYVVQRMAQLATLFSLLGIVIYLHARLQLKDKPIKAYLLMVFGIGLGTILATFSKENGALLPLLILVIEFCLPKDDGKPALPWRVICLWLPSIALFLVLSRYVSFAENPWPNRNFNMMERLLTEGRIVSEYLLHLFVPRIEGNGLYQDGYTISKSLTNPISTLYALLFLSSLFVSAFLIRKKAPVICLAILFFFSAHLMESTVIGLELYFEHRNHLAALFLFLPIAYYGVTFSKNYKLLPLALIAILILLASMTYLRATLWGDNNKLELYWVQSATNSPRAINSMASIYMRHHEYEKANHYLEEQIKRLPHSSLLTARLLLQKVHIGTANEQDFILAGQRLKVQEFDAQTIKGVRTIVEKVIESNNQDYAYYCLNLLSNMNESPVYNQFPLFIRLQYYLHGQLYRYLQQPDKMLSHYSLAIQHYQETDAALAMVAEVASAGYFIEALELLNQASQVFAQQPDRSLKRTRASYETDIAYLYETLRNSIEQASVTHEH